MKYDKYYLVLFVFFLPVLGWGQENMPKTWSSQEAWDFLPTYQAGDDWGPLFVLEEEVYQAATVPEKKKIVAARLAALLNEKTTDDGRQLICLQLRTVGGAAEVPILTQYLHQPKDSENARAALEVIPCEESLVSLREALGMFQGRSLVGVLASLAVRRDEKSLPVIAELALSEDVAVAEAAVRSLGKFGTIGLAALKGINPKVPSLVLFNTKQEAAWNDHQAGKTSDAKALFEEMTQAGAPRGIRRAGFEGLLALVPPTERAAEIEKWFFEQDEIQATIAANHLKELSSEQLDNIYSKLDQLNERAKLVFVEISIDKQGDQLFDKTIEMLKSESGVMRITAIRALGRLANPEGLAPLIALLPANRDPSEIQAIYDAISVLPKAQVTAVLKESLRQEGVRLHALEVLAQIKAYEAIDAIILYAVSEMPEVYNPALIALGKICDPDAYDIPRLLKVYLTAKAGAHREAVERAIIVVCDKATDKTKRAEQVLAAINKLPAENANSNLVALLPLLGKVGGEEAKEFILKSLTSNDAALQTAALRGLCNWPDATYKDELWKIASGEYPAPFKQMALRAFVRVVTLKSDRPENETLDMLKNAMTIAQEDKDKEWCLQRAATVRTMPAMNWAASYLDDPALKEAACNVVVELAHHRFLREPNKDIFTQVLQQVERTTQEKELAERANKYRLGM